MKNTQTTTLQEQDQKQQNYIELLQKAKEENKISAWKINKVKVRRNNFYLEKNYKIESIINSQVIEYEFTIYKEFEDSLGESSFVLSEADTAKDFEKELEDALFMCAHSKSKKYTLPTSKDENTKDEHINYKNFHNENFIKDFESKSLNLFLAQKIEEFKNCLQEIKEKNISLEANYMEFFNNITENTLSTSNNINKSYLGNFSYFEIVITAKNEITKKEFEHVVYEKINNIYTFNFAEFFKKHLTFAKDSLLAGENNALKNFKGKIILSDFAAYDFFTPNPPTPIITFASARLKFMKISNYEIGKKIINTKLDHLTIYANPLLQDNAASTPYDNDGISAKRTCIIKNSVFKNYFGSKQYSDYLGIKATGPLGVIEVEGGKLSEKELYTDTEEMMEIISFAWFSPDSSSGDFSAEIRLGYLHKNGKKIPFKGGLFTGNAFKIIEQVRFSKETINIPGYHGPKTIKFYEGEIVGM